METMPTQAQYVVDAAGKRTYAIVPIKFFDQLINKESVFTDIGEAAQWLEEKLPEDVNFKQDSIAQMNSHRTDAPEDLSERLDDYLYGKRI